MTPFRPNGIFNPLPKEEGKDLGIGADEKERRLSKAAEAEEEDDDEMDMTGYGGLEQVRGGNLTSTKRGGTNTEAATEPFLTPPPPSPPSTFPQGRPPRPPRL
jgi:hypothetical protein